MIIVVALGAVVTILRACRSIVAQVEPPVVIQPEEVSLCAGQQHQFTVEGGVEVTWETTGGSVTQSGLFTAGDASGDYVVTVTGRESGEKAQATVHVMFCAPTATPEPTATLVPTPTPTPEPVVPSSMDAQGDVGTYDSGVPVEGVPAGVDISAASISPDLGVALQPTGGVPTELAGWAGEGDALFWVSLHSPVASPPAAYLNWLIVLDVDGNTGTGRPAGSRRINPDLGDEVVIGVSYNPTAGAYEPYSLVWDAGAGGWATGPEIRYTVGESRTLVAFAISLERLTQSVSQYSGTTLAPEAVKGRAAAESYVGELRVIDFYPDLP
jgi:hypothetical protein